MFLLCSILLLFHLLIRPSLRLQKAIRFFRPFFPPVCTTNSSMPSFNRDMMHFVLVFSHIQWLFGAQPPLYELRDSKNSPTSTLRSFETQGVGVRPAKIRPSGLSACPLPLPKAKDATSNKRASLLGARTLLVAPGLTTRNKKLVVTRASLPALRAWEGLSPEPGL